MQTSLSLNFPTHNNKGLFADHYLNSPERLKHTDEWRQAPGIVEAFNQIQQLYEEHAKHFTEHTNEDQTELHFIQPVLNLLWGEECYQVEVPIPAVNAQRRPDYAFFRYADDCRNAESRLNTLEYWRDAVCLGDAKRWKASLDKRRTADENPSAQICNYLYRLRVRWGILTNGRIWRLYEREKSSAGGIFYEVNLEGFLQNRDPEAFKYFYLFFRREAFLPDKNGVAFVEKVFQGSVDYATEVGDRLKEAVYDALRLLMTGFFEYPKNELDRDDPETLKCVHENSLIVLYRLLFLLYAEHRNLLPGVHGTYSLSSLHQEINQQLRKGQIFLPRGIRFWGHLTTLFDLINEGFPEGKIPAYNGGLFSPEKFPHITHTYHPGVQSWEIGDHRLAEVIDMLAYRRETWNQPDTQKIDYATLDVQHLGSIYEGLLELQPHIAPEPMMETTENGKSVFTPQQAVQLSKKGGTPRIVDSGEIYLVTNRGERKASGSYYTPKYIVDYIVENTLGPLTDKATEEAAALRPDVEKKIKELEKTRSEWETTAAAERREQQIMSLNSAIEEQKRRLLEPYLCLKVLDPAMGSGHFLVGAADFLSLAMATDPTIAEFPLDTINHDDPQMFYKRLVVEHCLYGVDLNPLAVELAKLSLWLHTVSRAKALSFLDHHLRCGNSLIGARIEDDLMQEPPRFNARGKRLNAENQQLVLGFNEALTATHLQYFLDTFRKIMEAPSGDAEMERMKDKLYWQMDAVRDKFRAVANCWLAPYFGVSVTPKQYERAVKTLRGTEAEWQELTQEKWFQDVQTAAADKRFFHWELEFPEIFFQAHRFKPKEERGFGAVIGNPPYVRAETANKEQRAYLMNSDRYHTIWGRFDIFLPFIELNLHLLREKVDLGMIVPSTVLTINYAEKLRKFILTTFSLLQILDLRDVRVFKEAEVSTCILIVRKSRPEPHTQTFIACSDKNGSLLPKGAVLQKIFLKLPDIAIRPDINPDEIQFKELIDAKSIQMGQLCYCITGLVGHDSKTGASIDRLIYPTPINATCKPYIEAKEWEGRYSSLHPQRYIEYRPQLMHRPKFQELFESSKILIQRLTSGDFIQATIDRDKVYVNHVLNCCTKLEDVIHLGTRLNIDLSSLQPHPNYDLRYILALVCSRLLGFYHNHYLSPGLDIFPETIRQLPIRRIEFTTPDKKRQQLLDEARQFYQDCLSQKNYDSILKFVKHQLAQTPERADVVHDLLAFLAEQMIAMNTEKHKEMTGFLKWLERHIGADIEDLSNKTKIKAYHEANLNTLLSILRKNRRKLSINPTTRTVQEPIEMEFTASVAKLTPLKARIAATDRLIDRIVYKLYGLTEEEIAIVEGK